MNIKGMIRTNAYYDSITLMQISRAVEEIDGIESAMVCMGTEMNKELLSSAGLLTEEFRNASPSDLVIAFIAKEGTSETAVFEAVEKKLNEKKKDDKQEDAPPTSVASAFKRYPQSNISVISLPGQYAAQEVRKSLNRGLHVMLFSDNVSVQEEIDLKKLAHEKGLLMMGPDCGTAIINHVGLCFANEVREGSIGVIGASGTGTQEITVLIDHLGAGVSQVIGTGGRDLTLEVGGIMMLDAFEALENDEMTSTIVLISKPPVETVAQKIIERAKSSRKKVVICFINSERVTEAGSPIQYAATLEEAARKAVELASGTNAPELPEDFDPATVRMEFTDRISDSQKYVRGLYCGGTLCDEAAFLFSRQYPDDVFSNVGKVKQLEDARTSVRHSFVDLGDDQFTVGRPHPMIEPELRNKRLIKEALDPETAIVLFDVELGYGSHENPAGVAAKAVKEAKRLLEKENRHVLFVAYVLGTDRDVQNYPYQVSLLQNEGVVIARSNARAVTMCKELIGGVR